MPSPAANAPSSGKPASPSSDGREQNYTAPRSGATKLPLRDELGGEVGGEPLDAAFAAVAGFLHAAERRLRGRDHHRVDPDHAGLQLVADRGGGRLRTGEGIGRQPVFQRVRTL